MQAAIAHRRDVIDRAASRSRRRVCRFPRSFDADAARPTEVAGQRERTAYSASLWATVETPQRKRKGVAEMAEREARFSAILLQTATPLPRQR
jgi:hypothetical protein